MATTREMDSSKDILMKASAKKIMDHFGGSGNKDYLAIWAELNQIYFVGEEIGEQKYRNRIIEAFSMEKV